MKFKGAKIKEQGITFGIIIVKPHILNSQSEIRQMQGVGARAFGPIPIILMAQNARGVPTYVGRKDIAQFLSKIQISRIPWREYRFEGI